MIVELSPSSPSPAPPTPAPPGISNFQKEYFTFYETIENVLFE